MSKFKIKTKNNSSKKYGLRPKIKVIDGKNLWHEIDKDLVLGEGIN
jgi:hypothetical protein